MSGLMSVTGSDASGPLRVGTPITDYIVGQSAALAITTAIIQRTRTGKGSIIDASMLDATLAIMGPVVAEWTIAGRVPALAGNRPFSRSPFSGCFDTRDGKIVVIGNTVAQIRGLADVCGLTDLLDDPRIAEWKDHPELADEIGPLLAETFLRSPALEWERRLNAASVPCSKVRDVPEVLNEPHVRDRGALLEISVPKLDQTFKVPGVGFHLDGAAGAVRNSPPELGEHTEEVLAEAGYDASDIAELISSAAAVTCQRF